MLICVSTHMLKISEEIVSFPGGLLAKGETDYPCSRTTDSTSSRTAGKSPAVTELGSSGAGEGHRSPGRVTFGFSSVPVLHLHPRWLRRPPFKQKAGSLCLTAVKADQHLLTFTGHFCFGHESDAHPCVGRQRPLPDALWTGVAEPLLTAAPPVRGLRTHRRAEGKTPRPKLHQASAQTRAEAGARGLVHGPALQARSAGFCAPARCSSRTACFGRSRPVPSFRLDDTNDSRVHVRHCCMPATRDA